MNDTLVLETWSRILDRLKEEIGEKPFSMWFERCRVLGLKRGVLLVGVPNLFIRDWVEEHYGQVLNRMSQEVVGASVRVNVKVDADLFRQMRAETDRLSEVVDQGSDGPRTRTLNSYLLTPGNEDAFKALRHVAASEQPRMNPLVIHGPEGTGKSHLAEALTRALAAGDTYYTMDGETFARRFAWMLKTRKIEDWREEIAGARFVILDDIQALSGKMATQREFTRLLERVLANQGQLVLFLDRHPDLMEEIDPACRSFLRSGMMVEMRPPEAQDAVRVLQRVLRTAQRPIPTRIIEIVVAKVGGNVARMDRLIRKLYAFASLSGQPVDEEFLQAHLEEVAGPLDPVERRVEAVFSRIEQSFDIERELLLSKKKTKSLSLPRGVAVFILREHLSLTFKQIGKLMGGRSHTSVYLMYRKYEEEIRRDPHLQSIVKDVGRLLVSVL